MQYVTCEHIAPNKVEIYKSYGAEVSLIHTLVVQCTTYTFGPAQSCNFKKMKVYETKLYLFFTA